MFSIDLIVSMRITLIIVMSFLLVTSCSSDSGGDLLNAVKDGDIERAESLISQGVDPNFQDEIGTTGSITSVQ
jgi:ankyrin repeat protein